ncbi:Flp pilus assembly pilin Flp [Psychromicrobium silvestre]|uniref:Flp pilus assembly pilin Flp n=1 Tax=Psychromicrobium silvestre TaxID=1645614 RepID=A0A7Y9LTW7_9MICC|nr:hypothetical protein [Psychromicrobium silvestre]NYE95544.1 Flp pilus assembly pilin Flp [Psychromicrobium silvestre]
MSTPTEDPNQGQPGYQPPQQPADPSQAPGYQAPQGAPQQPYQQPAPGYQVPQQPAPGYQAPPGQPQQPGYQQPGYQPPGQQPGYQQPYQQAGQQPGQGNFQFQMPTDGPKSFNDVMPKGGFSGIFSVAGLPQLLKISYILWLITAGLWLISTVIGLIFSIIRIATPDYNDLNSLISLTRPNERGAGVAGLIVSIISLVLIAAIVVFAMKLKEGFQWARLALSIIAAVSIVLVFFGAGTGLIGVVATVLMWLPESTAWLNSRRNAPPAF